MSPPECECGLSYVAGHPDDETAHSRIHDEYLNGPILSGIENQQSISVVRTLDVIRLDRTVPLEVRKRLARVSYVAHRSMPDYKIGYDGSDSEENPRLFIVRDGFRGVAMIMIADSNRCWRLRWLSQGKIALNTRDASTDLRPVVWRVWVAKNYRRRGIASGLLRLIAAGENRDLSDFGWQLPLTVAGAHLVKTVVPGDWFGDGDPFDLREMLQDKMPRV